ncbi:MAG: hypothetical protein SFY80_04385 [Verrucomicrobiota bacterium]|nr:hypothetical protein [Verrucomicrobiota bacterium]
MDYFDVVKCLELWLQEHSGTELKEFPTARDWARELGASLSTVNRGIIYLSGKGLLTRTGRRYFYSRQNRTSTSTGLPIHYLCISGTPADFDGIVARMASAGRVLQIHACQTVERYYATAESLRQQPAAGIILGTPNCNVEDRWRHTAPKSNFPIVSINSEASFPYQVTVSLHQQISSALELLQQNGHTHIGGIFEKHGTHVKQLGYSSIEEVWAQCTSFRGLASNYLCPSLNRGRHYQEGFYTSYLENNSAITALVLDGSQAQILETLAATEKVPATLSLVLVGSISESYRYLPPLDWVTIPPFADMVWAIRLIDQLRADIESLGKLPAQCRIWLDSVVYRRQSVRAINTSYGAERKGVVINSPKVQALSTTPNSLPNTEAINADLAQPYPGLTGLERWASIDLSPVVNRGIRRYHSWFGEYPLLHLNSGQRTLHGIPFTLLDEESNRGHCAVVLSRPGMTQQGADLSQTVDISLNTGGQRLKALAFLHGAGWVKQSALLGRYILKNREGDAQTRLLYSVCMEEYALPRESTAVIGDWWPIDYHASTPDSRIAIIAGNDPMLYSRYLYTHLWWLPDSHSRWETLTITLDPEAPAAYGLLALTALVE